MRRSTTISIFPDPNVWLALNHAIHQHHAAAVEWFEVLPEQATFVFCRHTQLGFFRLLTTAAVMGDDVLTQAQCWAIYDQWTRPGKAVLAAEPTGLEPLLRVRTCTPRPSPKEWADAYLAAFAEAAGFQLATFDRVLAAKASGTILLA
jgi:hypothetical protein